jgi:hypothetical protein
MSRSTEDLELEEQFFPTQQALLQRWIPWLRLLRGFRMAIDYRRMCLALLAVLIWSAGDWLLQTNSLPGAGGDNFQCAAWPWEPEALPAAPATRERIELPAAPFNPGAALRTAFSNGRVVLWPLERILAIGRSVVFPLHTPGDWLRGCAVLIWGLAVCGLFGGAISRMAAIDCAQAGEFSIRSGLRFSFRHWLSYLGAPLITVVALGGCGIFNLVAGLVARIPILGETLVGILWIFPLMAGLCMALVVIGVAAGWPLMIAAISTEGSDAFDGLSRSYGYLFNRPWYAIWLLVLSLLYGSALLFFVTGVMTLSVDLMIVFLQTGLGDIGDSGLLADLPAHPAWSPWMVGTTNNASPAAAYAIGAWMRLIASVPAAFVFSFFWTISTLIYVLLRRREDATPLDEVSPDSAQTNPDLLPIVGIPAAEHREKTMSPASPTDSPADHSGHPPENRSNP